MSKQRRVNTSFWDDPYIEILTKDEKYLFLFLLTNPHTNIAGIYEISVKKIAFYTGLTESNISKTFKKFIKDEKIFYIDKFVFMLNHIKHQMLSEKIVIGIKNIIEELPFDLSDCFIITKHRVSYSIDRLRCIYKDRDINIDINKDIIKEDIVIVFNKFWDLYNKKVGDKEKLIKKFSKLSQQDINAIMIYIPKYKQATPDKKFRKNPETFLNNRSWNDEIITKQDTSGKPVEDM